MATEAPENIREALRLQARALEQEIFGVIGRRI